MLLAFIFENSWKMDEVLKTKNTKQKDKVPIFEMEKSEKIGEEGINIDQLVNFIFHKSTRTNNQIKCS